MINCHIAAECFVPQNWIVLLSDKGRTVIVAACVNTHCRGGGVVLFLQNKIPPYESRITTTKLLVEAEEYEVKCCVLCSCILLLLGLCMFSWWEGGLAFVCVCACVCVFSFLVNSTEGGKAMPGLYPFQSSVSIIEDWYFQRGTGVRGRTWEEGWGEGEKKRKEGSSTDELLPYL